MNLQRPLYDYDRCINSTLAMIKSNLSDDNARLLVKYHKVMMTSGLAKATRLRSLQQILNLSRFLKVDWKDATADDIEDLVVIIHEKYTDERGKETNSSYDHKKMLKIFFRWFKLGSRSYEEVGNPPETQHVKMRKVEDKLSREDLITEDDKNRLLHVCYNNLRDRAFIDVQYEAGTRPGEVLNLQIKHVQFDKYGAIIKVDGKTGARQVRLIRSVPNLSQWIAVHPLKDDINAPLWIDLSVRHHGENMTYPAARIMMIRRAKQAGLKKRVHLNLFRHSEATYSAGFLTEAQMRVRHGWTSYSKMTGKYVHISGGDVDKAILRQHGFEIEPERVMAKPKQCTMCGTSNPMEVDTCIKCGRPLNLDAAIQMDDASQVSNDTLKDMDELKAQLKRQDMTIESLKQLILEKFDGSKTA